MRAGKLREYLGISTSLLMLAASGNAWAAQTLEYSIRWNTADERYHVYMRPTTTPSPDLSMTGQVTIRVPTATLGDAFTVSGLTSTVAGTAWSRNSRVNAPSETDNLYDYISFTLTADTPSAFAWQANKEIEVFNFANTGKCLGPVALMENSDPFNVTPNSAGTNPGNQFTNNGWIDAPGENNYLRNYGSAADCTDSLDTDGDGLKNGEEKLLGTDPTVSDSDGDGLSDGTEVNITKTDPLLADSDGDGLNDGLEVNTLKTNPNSSDSDGDGVPDATEVGADSANPLDTDDDGIIDALDTDDDNDGLLTSSENYNGGSPVDDDTDADGIPDYLDDDDDGDGIPSQFEGNDPNRNKLPDDAWDTDGDGIPNYLDANDNDGPKGDLDKDGISNEDEEKLGTDPTSNDSDGDGVPDEVEWGSDSSKPQDTDNDGIIDILDTDDDGDGIPTKNEDLNLDGDGDPSTNPLDTDGDGIPNYLDNDDDGDGILTIDEAKNLDRDGDGIIDYLDGDDSDGPDGDSDGDGLTNRQEEQLGLDPNKVDTDGDGIPDAVEVGPQPSLPIDTDNDGIIDALDPDDDGDGIPTIDEGYDPNGDGNFDDAIDSDGDGIPDYLDATVDNVSLQVRLVLQGAIAKRDPAKPTVLMRDNLRTLNLIPNEQPYNFAPYNYQGSEKIATGLLAVEGADAIVDWVLIELRSKTDNKQITHRVAALLQTDGDVIDATTGSNSLQFPSVQVGDYYVAVRHRNHLGVMSAEPVSLQPTATLVDFAAPDTAVYGEYARIISMSGYALLWGGEVNHDNRLIGAGPGQDIGAVYARVLSAKENTSFSSNFVVNGYHVADFNMDGRTIFSGPDNDTNVTVGNIQLHPGNINFNANYIVKGQLP